MARLDGLNRRHVAVVITTDGRRVQMPVHDASLGRAVLGLVRLVLIGLEDLLELITGSRRENGGTPRDERR